MKQIVAALAALLVFSQSAQAHTWVDSTLGGYPAFLITPTTPAPGNPWIAYAPTLANDDGDIDLPAPPGAGGEPGYFTAYLDAGIAIAGIAPGVGGAGDKMGNPAHRAAYTLLYDELVGDGYAPKFSFHARSRGGLLAHNWAADNPGKVAAIGGLFPVTNYLSYPGEGLAAGLYGLTVQEFNDDLDLYNPNERLLPLFNSGVKMFHIAGDSDTVVPLEDNSQIMKDGYDALGGTMTLTVIAGAGHGDDNDFYNNQPFTDFMIGETLAAAATVGPPTLNTLSSVVPADDAEDVITTSNFVATFSEPIALTGSGTINLKNLSAGADIPVTLPGGVTIVGSVLTIDPASDLVEGQEYAVEISPDAIEDLEATPLPYAGLLSTDTPNWSFTGVVPDETDPTISSLSPGEGASGVSVGADLEVTFDEEIVIGTGNITIKDLDSPPAQTVIPVGDGQISVSGAVLTINPGSNLAASTNYAIQIDATAIDDLSGNSFAGITVDTIWNFATQGEGAIIPQGQLTATSGGTDPTWPDEQAVVDGTQMTGEGATGLHKGTLSYPDGWYTTEANNWFKVDLGATVDVGKMYVWNGQEEIPERGVESADIYYSTVVTTDPIPTGGASSGDWILITAGQAFNEIPVGTADFLPSDAFDLDVSARSIGLYLSGSGGLSLSELQFFEADTAPPANTFANWIGGYAVGGLTDFGDDVDGDNLTNGLEAWFGTHPGQFNAGLSEFSTDGTTTSFEHPQNDDPPSDLSGYYKWSTNLKDWYASGNGPGGGLTVSFVPNTVGTTTTVTATASEALDRLFVRVGVMQN